MKVIKVDAYRDGDTVSYKDKAGKMYFHSGKVNKVFDGYPGLTKEGVPTNSVNELKVKLQIVKYF